MRLATRLTLAVLVLTSVAPVQSVAAHGPCDCLFPTLAEPGAKVTIGLPAYRVLLNPRPAQFGIAPGYLASAYHPDSPTVTLISRPEDKPKQKLTFRVPGVPPGLYMLLIFDGEEGGAHNTWEYLHVTGRAPKALTPRPAPTAATRSAADDADSGRRLAWLAVGIALGVGGAFGYSRWAPSRRR